MGSGEIDHVRYFSDAAYEAAVQRRVEGQRFAEAQQEAEWRAWRRAASRHNPPSSKHSEDHVRWIEELNERNRESARGGPYLYIDPYASKPPAVIGLRPRQAFSYEDAGIRHMFWLDAAGAVQHGQTRYAVPPQIYRPPADTQPRPTTHAVRRISFVQRARAALHF